MLELIITETAKQNFVDIAEYTIQKWGVEQEEKYTQQLLDRCRWLTENPELGKDRGEIEKGDFSYHEGKHQIFYIYNDKLLTVLAVLHESMDFKNHL